MLSETRRRPVNRALLLGCGVALAAFSTGCVQVIRQEAPYYKEGPQQVGPPDGFFVPGTHVWVLGEKDSYARVLALDGRAGHVWNRDLASVFEWRKLQSQSEQSQAEQSRAKPAE